MKIKVLLAIPFFWLSVECFSQVYLKTEYIGSSQYWHEIDDDTREKVGDSKGGAMVWEGGATLPISVKMNADSMPTIWGVALSGAYVQLDNENFTDDMVSDIMNLQLGILNMKPLNIKWSVLSVLGGGVYAPFTDFSKIRYENILCNVGVIFIRHLKPNLDLGGGLAINSTFGYPMVFPAMYFDWRLERNFDLNISMLTGFDVKCGYRLSKNFKLNLNANINGQMALLEKDGEDVMFTHQYMVAGLTPEVSLGKHCTVSLTTGVSAMRPAYYNQRSLKGVFSGDSGFYFGVSPYASFGIVFK